MSLNPDVEGITSLSLPTNGTEPEVSSPVAIAEPVARVPVVATPVYEPPPPPSAPPWEVQVVAAPAQAPAQKRKRAGWIVAAAIAVVGLLASGTLGYFVYTTAGQRDAARHRLASTQATLADTEKELEVRKATDAYLNLYLVNSGRVETDYQAIVACDSYSTCRSAAQDALINMKAFQSARSTIAVPSALASADSQLGDALSAAIAADQELITGMDSDDLAKMKEGGKRFDAAMLSFAKAETALAVSLS